MPHAVTWFDISSNDPDSLAAFYTKAFKWKIEPPMGMIQAEKDGEQQGIAGSLSQANGGPGGVLVYVTCPDIEAQLEKVQAAGGTPQMPRIDLPNDMGSIATFSDPQGNTVGLWAQARPAKSAKKSAKKAAKAESKPAAKKAAKKAPKKAPPPSVTQAPAETAKKAAKKAPKKAAKKGSKKAPPPAVAQAPAAKPAKAAKAPAKKAGKKRGKK